MAILLILYSFGSYAFVIDSMALCEEAKRFNRAVWVATMDAPPRAVCMRTIDI